MVFSIRTIHEIKDKVKGGVRAIKNLAEKEDIFIVLLLVLVGFGGFGLGRLSMTMEAISPVLIHPAPDSRTVSAGGEGLSADTATTNGKNFVASVAGSKYHLPWCSGVESIKEENKIWFATVDAARAAGYSPAANCKGL